jgi:hypothetical protein
MVIRRSVVTIDAAAGLRVCAGPAGDYRPRVWRPVVAGARPVR